MSVRALPTCVAAAALALVGCGGSSSALGQTAAKLDEIRSGMLRLEASIRPERAGDAFSYELSGPFRFPEGEGIASARLRYRQSVGDRSEQATLFVDGGRGWVEADGARRELTDEQLEALSVGPSDDDGFLSGLDLEEWFVDPETQSGPRETLVVSGRARVGRTLEGLIGLAGGLGRSGRLELDDEDEQQLERAARASRLQLVTGAEDHLLRRLRYELELGLDVPRMLEAALGDIGGARLLFDLEIASPNGPVEISP